MSRRFRPGTIALLLVALSSCGPPPEIPAPSELGSTTDARLVRAVGKARAQVEAQPDSAAAWGQLGHVYLAHNWDFESAECYRRAAALAPREAQWPYFLGRSLFTLDDAEAARAFERAIELGGEYPPALYYLGKALSGLGRFDEAESRFERLVALDPGNPHACLALGELALADDALDVALGQFERAVSEAPEFSEAHAGLAKLRLALGDREAAAREAALARRPSRVRPLDDPLWRAVRMASLAPEGFFARAAYYIAGGQVERGLDEMEQAVADGQDDPEVWLYYASVMLDQHRFDRVVAAADRVGALASEGRRRLAPHKLASAHVLAGAARAKLGDAAGAERDLLAALELDPGSTAAIEELVAFYRGAGRPDDARRIAEAAPRASGRN